MGRHTVAHGNMHGIDDDQPPYRILGSHGGVVARCNTAGDADRVARGLDLVDAFPAPGVIVYANGIPEDEILQRAREAAIASGNMPVNATKQQVRSSLYDQWAAVASAARALRDLAKPLSEVVPKPVDPDLIEARKIAAEAMSAYRESARAIVNGEQDQSEMMKAALAAIKRGRDMALEHKGLRLAR